MFDNAPVEVRRGLTALAVDPLSLDELVQFAEVGEIDARFRQVGSPMSPRDGSKFIRWLATLAHKAEREGGFGLLVRRAFEYALGTRTMTTRLTFTASSVLMNCLKISSRLRTRHPLRLNESQLSPNLALMRRPGIGRNSLTDLISAEVALIGSEYVRAHSLGIGAANALPSGHTLKARGSLIAGRRDYFFISTRVRSPCLNVPPSRP